MLETGQADARTPRVRRTFGGDESAVSPVVGMIMVLAISVVGIGATVYWGLPTIDEMKSNVEFRSAESQFNDLDSTIKELVAGTTQRTAKLWQPSISRGEIRLVNETEQWLFATEPYNAATGGAHTFHYGGLENGDKAFVVKNSGPASFANVKVEAYRVSGSSETLLNVSTSAASNAQHTAFTFNSGEEKQLYVWLKGRNIAHSEQNIAQGLFHFKVFSGSDLVGEMWYVETGKVTYDLAAGFGNKAVVENNGAVITGTNDGFAIANTPSMPAPVTTANTPRFFARAVVLNGTGEFAGLDRFDVLLSLYATSTLASYDCAQPSKSDCVVSSKIAVLGDYQAPWYAYLKNTQRGYAYTESTVSFPSTSAPTVKYLEDRRTDGAAYTLLASDINLGVS